MNFYNFDSCLSIQLVYIVSGLLLSIVVLDYCPISYNFVNFINEVNQN